MSKKQGRPKAEERRVSRGFAFSESTMDALEAMTERYRAEAPPYLAISQRVVIEALIDYAVRRAIPLSEIIGKPKSTARQVAEKHGIDLSQIPDQSEQVDTITERRMSEE